MLLDRPLPFEGVETVNDFDGLLANFWRSMSYQPDKVIEHADWPVNEADLHARHLWLLGHRESLTMQLMGDPEWCDPRAAGWWVWGISAWIGSGWCAGEGPWVSVNGVFTNRNELDDQEQEDQVGVSYQRPHLGDMGQGVHKKRPLLGNMGQGVHKKRPHLGDMGRLFDNITLEEMATHLAGRLRHVRVCCGDWSRVVQDSVIHMRVGLPCGIFLDPPYAQDADRDMGLYAMDSGTVAHDVRAWCLANGDNRNLRIALAGYEVEHKELESHGWDVVEWKALGGMSNGNKDNRGYQNKTRERIWFSPHCLSAQQRSLL